jgi:hypothetical protein
MLIFLQCLGLDLRVERDLLGPTVSPVSAISERHLLTAAIIEVNLSDGIIAAK